MMGLSGRAELPVAVSEAAARVTMPLLLPAVVVSRPTLMLLASVPPAARPVMAPVTVAPFALTGLTSSAAAGGAAVLEMLTAWLSWVSTRTLGKMIVDGVFKAAAALAPMTSSMVRVMGACAAWKPLELVSSGVKVMVSLWAPGVSDFTAANSPV